VGAGTVEFLVQDDEFFFMEMNTRLQVEHPVTELVTGTDLVEWQLRVAAGEPLPITQEEVPCNGHAVEVRLYCEDTENDFLPSTGRLDALELPVELEGIRVETGVRRGDEVTPYYDAMIAKIIAHGDDRDAALVRLRAALGRTIVGGVTTNLGFLSLLLKEKSFSRGVVDTRFVSRWENGNAYAFQPRWKWDVLAALAVLVELRERALDLAREVKGSRRRTKKLAELEAAQAANHAMRAESGDAPKIRQWLKSLRQNPLKTPQPASGPGPSPMPVGEPFDELVDTAVVAQPAGKTVKTETNH